MAIKPLPHNAVTLLPHLNVHGPRTLPFPPQRSPLPFFWTKRADLPFRLISLSDEDKRERYRQGLPYRIKDEFAITAHDISDLVKTQTVALKMDQQLAARAEEKPRNFSFRNRGGKIAATNTPPPFRGNCNGCGKQGHKVANCPDRQRNGQQVAASSSSSPPVAPSPAPTSSSNASDELTALRTQMKLLEERIAALTVARESEGF